MSSAAAAGLQEEPILSRFNRLDHILKQLEDIKSASQSPKSSYASSNFSSSDRGSISPDGLEKQRCRPVDDVLMEVDQKGTLIQRLNRAEDRIFKVCLQLEDELEGERISSRGKQERGADGDEQQEKLGGSAASAAGLKKLVKSCLGKSKKTATGP